MGVLNFGIPTNGATKIRRVTGLSGGTGVIQYASFYGAPAANATVVLTPLLPAATWTDAIVINGPGQVNWAAVEAYGSVGAGSAGRLILDGVTVITTTAGLSTTYNSAMLVGGFAYDVANSQSMVAFQPIQFNSQLKIQVKVGTINTQFNVAINYEVHAL